MGPLAEVARSSQLLVTVSRVQVSLSYLISFCFSSLFSSFSWLFVYTRLAAKGTLPVPSSDAQNYPVRSASWRSRRIAPIKLASLFHSGETRPLLLAANNHCAADLLYRTLHARPASHRSLSLVLAFALTFELSAGAQARVRRAPLCG